ncbi:exonuclease domain-containing protein [Zhouia sp. PK063]|uniref:exonuclease domain-containing protein n=1 Tax=Zhouia sp. PK063 TaxID=3373602 RepID=UPI0037916D3A
MYAILDIETTGGKYNEEGITEIAIYKFDGHKVVDQFISLVNPEREIQPFVVKLTGINTKMLRTAPKFYEVAKRIVEITQDCIIVAHNAQFDYRILRTEFRRLGFDFQRKTICTVELSQKLLPEAPSYSLGKLVRSLGIPVSDRHRANGDAQATVKLFKLLLTKDTEKSIIRDSVKAEGTGELSPRLIDIVDQIPATIGVYYLHKDDGSIIFIGKSRNMKKRVNQLFTGSSKKAKLIQKDISVVTYEETGNELIALLKEHVEVKQNKPKYNTLRKKRIFSHALYQYIDDKGYIRLYIAPYQSKKKEITTFKTEFEAKNSLYKLTEEFELCNKLNGISEAKTNCFNYTIGKCKGACIAKESVETYNTRAEEAIKKYSYISENMVIVDRGREIDERSAILIENHIFQGLGFYNLNHQLNNIHILHSIITPMNNSVEITHIIQSYLRKKKVLKIVTL